MSSREFEQSTGTAKVAALTGPVPATDTGRPSHVLLSYDRCRRLTDGAPTPAHLMGGKPDARDVQLEPSKVGRAFLES